MANTGKYIFENRETQFLFKLLVIGDSGVGKSALLQGFADNKPFTELHKATIGVDFRNKDIKHEDDNIKLQIWDTAGQEKYHDVTSSVYREAHGIIIVYDVTNSDSFENIHYWLKGIDEHADEGCKRLLVGNKSDLDDKRKVSYERGVKLAEEMGMPFLEASAKNDEGIFKAYEMLATEI